MKKLIYQIAGYTSVFNEETETTEEQISLCGVTVENPTDEDIAKASEVAYNGVYKIEDDGEPEPVPTTDDILNALLGV